MRRLEPGVVSRALMGPKLSARFPHLVSSTCNLVAHAYQETSSSSSSIHTHVVEPHGDDDAHEGKHSHDKPDRDAERLDSM